MEEKIIFLNKELYLSQEPYATLAGRLATGFTGFGIYLKHQQLIAFIKAQEIEARKNLSKLELALDYQTRKYTEFLNSEPGKKLEEKQSTRVRNTVSLIENMLAIAKSIEKDKQLAN